MPRGKGRGVSRRQPGRPGRGRHGLRTRQPVEIPLGESGPICYCERRKHRVEGEFTIALAGGPNVGKSVLFNAITGIGAISSNYPGTTVEVLRGVSNFEGQKLRVSDLPGTYSLVGTSVEERVAIRFLFEERPDAVVAVVDSTRLIRNLAQVFQLIEQGFNVVVALNMIDILEREKRTIDTRRLSQILGVPVIPTVATKGKGVPELIRACIAPRKKNSKFKVRYDTHTERVIGELSRAVEEEDCHMQARGAALLMLERPEGMCHNIMARVGTRLEEIREEFQREHGEDIGVHIMRDRFGEAGKIDKTVEVSSKPRPPLRERVADITLDPRTGIPMLIGMLMLVFFILLVVGGALEGILVEGYHAIADGFFASVESSIGGVAGQVVSEGVSLSIEAVLAIVIPYIMVFYILLGFLEDSGYIPRVVTLLDGLMHRIGLHGGSVIPMLVGVGCSVPAILATRMLNTRREKIITATIVVIAIPCSAQTAIILGIVGAHAGFMPALFIYIILLSLVVIVGLVLNRIMPKQPTGLIMEMPDLRWPHPLSVLKKTWMRMREFFKIAFPILLVGSILLTALLSLGLLQPIIEPLSPLTEGWLGLPPIIIIALIFGVLRKEMAIQMLIVLLGTSALETVLSPVQLFTFALVMAIYLPCLATFVVMRKEFGIRDTMVVALISIAVAFFLGGVASFAGNIFM